MLRSEDIFKLIKKERNFLGNIDQYKIKISNSDNFDRDNLIGIYKIRQYSTTRNGNDNLSQEIGTLILNLENYSNKTCLNFFTERVSRKLAILDCNLK